MQIFKFQLRGSEKKPIMKTQANFKLTHKPHKLDPDMLTLQ